MTVSNHMVVDRRIGQTEQTLLKDFIISGDRFIGQDDEIFLG